MLLQQVFQVRKFVTQDRHDRTGRYGIGVKLVPCCFFGHGFKVYVNVSLAICAAMKNKSSLPNFVVKYISRLISQGEQKLYLPRRAE